MSNPSRQHSKVLYRWGYRRRGKMGNNGKVGMKRKWWVLAQLPYAPKGNRRQSPKVEPFNQGDRLPDAEENLGSQYHQRLGGQVRLQAHSRYIYIKQE